MNELIHGYRMLTDFTTSNAGMCQWGFAEKGGHEFFIKQLLSPKYPLDESVLDRSIIQAMRSEADSFFEKRKRYYEVLATCRTGNLITVHDFFRDGSFYYVVTDRVHNKNISLREMSSLPEDQKRLLIKVLLHAVSNVHEKHIVHSDLKLDNVLFKVTEMGYLTTKLIDFDAGFFEDDVPDEVQGDQVYFSPEAILKNNEEDVEITTKSDIFSLGLLLHQFWCGHLPSYDVEEYQYASVALLEDQPLGIDPSIPWDIAAMIKQMLSFNPEDRPSARQVLITALRDGLFISTMRPREEEWEQIIGGPAAETVETPVVHVEEKPARTGFSRPSDDDLL